MLISEEKNYCDASGNFSICTAGDDWMQCLHAERHRFFPDCAYRVDMGDMVHCDSIDAQKEAR